MKKLYKTTVVFWTEWEPTWPIVDSLLNPWIIGDDDPDEGHGRINMTELHSETTIPERNMDYELGLNKDCPCDTCVCGAEEE